jgi:hypothetical protein
VLACAVHGDALEHLLGGVFILAVALADGAGGLGSVGCVVVLRGGWWMIFDASGEFCVWRCLFGSGLFFMGLAEISTGARG